MASSPDNGQYVIERAEAQRSATLIQAAALVGAGVCIALAARLQGPINEQRKELQLVMQSDIYKELPPEYAWVSAFGGAFRGIAVDLLWMRAEGLKQEGKYYESHQLAKWICTLQPRFAQVWSFQAWNMSYNISVATHTPQERWQWVYNGIRLLRDEGIPNNERVVPLYHQMAWTWFHKVGDRMDDFHNYYKRSWAATMETLLGPPPATVSDAEAIDWFRPVAEAPRTLEALTADHPGVSELVQALDDLGIDLGADTSSQRVFHPLEEQFFDPYTAYLNQKSLAALRTKPPEQTEPQRRLAEFFAAHDAKEDFRVLLAYLRAKVLREQYKMDPAYMLEITGRLGTAEPIPIDWRTPWSQAIYWAMYGVEKGRQARNLKEFDHLNTDRILLHSLATLVKVGRYTFRINLDKPMDSFLSMGPDFRYLEAMHNKYLELGRKHAEPGEEIENRTSDMLRSGHVNNLEFAIAALYMAGREDDARQWLEYLAQYYPDLVTKKTNEMYLKSVDDFVLGQLKDMADSYTEAKRLIHGILHRGYIALATGRGHEYDAAVRNAGKIYKVYQQAAADSPGGRTKMHPFPQIRANTLSEFVTDTRYPLSIRSGVWGGEQNAVKQYGYDYALGHLTAECEREGVDVDRAFPEPAGMQQWRKEHPAPVQPEDQGREESAGTSD